MSSIIKNIVQQDEWAALKKFTAARIALGRTGTAIPLKEVLNFKLAHAHARDAVYSELHINELIKDLDNLQLPYYILHSKAQTRNEYLQRSDLGKHLNDASHDYLKEENENSYDVALIIADGLSATAIHQNSIPLLKELLPLLQQKKLSLAPISMVKQARVAIGDEIGSLLKAKISIVLIGERPGLSAVDSLGVYLTYLPTVGLTDERRNCISNIRKEGMQHETAAKKIMYLINESLRLKISGVAVKDNDGLLGK
jgi:ethanolamine ammonia-lyase small subunit